MIGTDRRAGRQVFGFETRRPGYGSTRELYLAVETAADPDRLPGIVAELHVVGLEEIPACGREAQMRVDLPSDRGIARPIRRHFEAGQGADESGSEIHVHRF